MKKKTIQLDGKNIGVGYVIPLQGCNLVLIKTEEGLLGCGAIDVDALAGFDIPAACVSGVSTLEDLLEGSVKKVNSPAAACGISTGMPGREALRKMSRKD